MATLTVNSPKVRVPGDISAHPMIASDIIFEGAAVGLVIATGHAQPLAALDKFVGFAESKHDNSAGAAADKNVRVIADGVVKLSVSGAVITDVGQPVYATDDDTFVFNPVGAVYIGTVLRFISAGVVEVAFDAMRGKDPYAVYGAPRFYETISANKTLDVQDNGKVFFVDTDAKVITLPAEATGIQCTIVNIGAFGAVLVAVSPAAADLIHAPDLAGTDNKDHLNTKATAQRGDLVQLMSGLVATGYTVTNQVGIWAQEA